MAHRDKINNAGAIAGYKMWLMELLNSEMHSSFVTFQFRHCPGNVKRRLEVMAGGIVGFYKRLACQCARHPGSNAARHQLPIMFAYPDFPVPKNEKKSIVEVSINGGLHWHGLAFISPASRFKESLAWHLCHEQAAYANDNSPLYRVTAETVTGPNSKLVSYFFKQWSRGKFDNDNILILPASSSELA